jgi:hypothetical protein
LSDGGVSDVRAYNVATPRTKLSQEEMMMKQWKDPSISVVASVSEALMWDQVNADGGDQDLASKP